MANYFDESERRHRVHVLRSVTFVLSRPIWSAECHTERTNAQIQSSKISWNLTKTTKIKTNVKAATICLLGRRPLIRRNVIKWNNHEDHCIKWNLIQLRQPQSMSVRNVQIQNRPIDSVELHDKNETKSFYDKHKHDQPNCNYRAHYEQCVYVSTI